ncbi:hypothetical protein FRC09_018311 [Ceratobasidium sp. 395]|nr:hypothetical protein FRC09_018311 [Ceratobasidium sp. 395]
MQNDNLKILEQQDLVHRMMEKDWGNKTSVKRKIVKFQRMLKSYMWRCIVYDANKLTPATHNHFVHNSHEKPATGTTSGNKA